MVGARRGVFREADRTPLRPPPFGTSMRIITEGPGSATRSGDLASVAEQAPDSIRSDALGARGDERGRRAASPEETECRPCHAGAIGPAANLTGPLFRGRPKVVGFVGTLIGDRSRRVREGACRTSGSSSRILKPEPRIRSTSARNFGQPQARVGQVEPVHDLVVFVVRRRVRVAAEGVDVRALQVDHPPALAVEERVLRRVVEVVGIARLVRVRDDLPRVDPRAPRGGRPRCTRPRPAPSRPGPPRRS